MVRFRLKHMIYNCEANNAMYDELFTDACQALIDKSSHGKAAENIANT